MPNISVKRLIKKAAVSPAPFHSFGLRGRVKKNRKNKKTTVIMITVGQFPYHLSKDICSSLVTTALEKSMRADLIRNTTIITCTITRAILTTRSVFLCVSGIISRVSALYVAKEIRLERSKSLPRQTPAPRAFPRQRQPDGRGKIPRRTVRLHRTKDRRVRQIHRPDTSSLCSRLRGRPKNRLP